MKKQFIFAFSEYCSKRVKSTGGVKIRCFWVDNRCLKEIITVVENFLTSEVMPIFKRNVFDVFVKQIKNAKYWYKIKLDVFREIEIWCLDAEQEVSEFKLSLPIDDIFSEMFAEQKCDDYPWKNIIAAENLLEWYFVTPQDIREYKLSKIYQFEEHDTLSKFIKRYLIDDSTLNMILPWFFDNDEEQICRFKLDRSEDSLSAMISLPIKVYDYWSLDFEFKIKSKIDRNSKA